MREEPFKGGTDNIRRVRGGRTAMKLIPAVIADAGINYGRNRRLEFGQRNVAGWVEKSEF
jgi:hypothetical protein